MRPHVVGRPLALVRCPEGAGGQCFFQKHAHTGIPTEFLHLVPEKGDKIISIDNLDGLIALVQGGALEIHVRGAPIDDRERADRLVFDLDPGPGTGWADVVEAAREVRARLSRVKLKSFVKTTGGKGLHVVVPIRPEPWDTAKEFAHAVAQSMAKDDPEALSRHRHQGAAQEPHLRRLPAQQPRGDRRRPLFLPRARRRAGRHAGRLVRARQPDQRPPIHGAERDAAPGPAEKRPVGRHAPDEAGAAEVQIRTTKEKGPPHGRAFPLANTRDPYAAACWFTERSAILLSKTSAFFSSSSVSCRSLAICGLPISFAHAHSVP